MAEGPAGVRKARGRMDDHRREILAQCAAVRVALDALDRAGELVTDEVEYAVAHVERWCTGEEGDEVIDEVEATVARIAAGDGGNEGAFGAFVYARMAAGETEIAALVAAVAAEFDAPLDVIEADVKSFVSSRGLVCTLHSTESRRV